MRKWSGRHALALLTGLLTGLWLVLWPAPHVGAQQPPPTFEGRWDVTEQCTWAFWDGRSGAWDDSGSASFTRSGDSLMLEYWTSELEEYLSSFGDVIGSMNGRQFVSSLSDETGQVQGYRKIVLTLSDDGNAFTGTIDEDHLGVYEYHCTVSGTRWNPDSESDETDPPSPTPTPQAMPVPTLDCRVTCCPGIWLTAEEVDAWQHIQAGDSGYSCLRCAFAAVDTVYAFDDGGCGWDKDRGPDNWEKYEACLAMCGQSPAEPTPTGCFLELEVDPQSVSAGEVAYLSLRASRGAGEPIVGQLAQVVIQEGPGDILESPLATNEDGEVLFIYQAPADIIAQTTVQLIATVAGCPDDAATASLSLQAAAGLEVEVSPLTMNEIGDVVTVTVSVITPQGSPLVGETVTLALLEPEEEPIAAQTDADGIAFFTISLNWLVRPSSSPPPTWGRSRVRLCWRCGGRSNWMIRAMLK